MTPQSSEYWRRQAILYAIGELSPEEAAAFETGLAESQDLREALVGAMAKLTANWSGVGPDSSWRVRLRRRLKGSAAAQPSWWTLALAACVGFLTAWTLLASLSALHRPGTFSADSSTGQPGGSQDRQALQLSRSDSDPVEGSAALTYVDLTTSERVAELSQSASGQKHSARSSPPTPAHLPLLEYFSRPCPEGKSVGM